ncbi:MAG: hypothetical protein E7271_03875 [Lachnospiraceae bacterium]|jgi:hypothetical protein|nr:hypothetical protein [Lachnospiraceae bacterium]
MPKGPKLNNISKNFTTRDSLGIEGVATTIQAEICPVVNTVTPRAFYWPFMAWIYYDFYRYSGIEEHNLTAFDKYLKRQDYFFVLATLLTEGSDQSNLVGKQQSQIDIDENPSGPYLFNPNYFKTTYGGMQYYNAGCLSMYFITDYDPENDKSYSFPVLRLEGEEMAKAFEAVIKNTRYYKEYRRNEKAVPRDVLEEYGKVINLGLDGFDECKGLLRHYLFEDDRAVQLINRSRLLTDCGNYLKTIVTDNGVTEMNRTVCRQMFYDHQLPNGKDLVVDDALVAVVNKWEIVVGRMYFASGIGMIWKYMLEQLNGTLMLKEWISQSINNADYKWDLESKISDVIEECEYDFNTREKMISATAQRNTSSYSIENGLKIILSVYNRFVDRTDFGDEKIFFEYGEDSQSISINELFLQVKNHMDKTIKDFIVYIMKHWLVEQHYYTAFNKLLQGRDGFYYEIIDGRYIRKHEYDVFFQENRMVQLTQVMRDLDML